MPLDRYGVLLGTLTGSFRDTPDDQGRWFHVNLQVQAPAGQYRCAVDVDSKQSSTGAQWKVLTLAADQLGGVPALAAGYHGLAPTPTSGALDFHRHPSLRSRPGCLFVSRPAPWLQALLDLLARSPGWRSGSNLDAAGALEPILVPGRAVMVFGEPFAQGLGMHNVHQNQGDPAGTQWWDENGIWQDGATATVRPDGMLDVFLSKFSTQASRTDDDGHPV
jgi:hypothetical protein